MTREEAITVIKAFMENPLFSDVHKAAFSIAIHDIKQRHDWDINNLILINKDNYQPLEQEPGKGHWIDHSDDGYVECPKCGSATNCDGNIADLHFCFSCGADMREVEE